MKKIAGKVTHNFFSRKSTLPTCPIDTETPSFLNILCRDACERIKVKNLKRDKRMTVRNEEKDDNVRLLSYQASGY